MIRKVLHAVGLMATLGVGLLLGLLLNGGTTPAPRDSSSAVPLPLPGQRVLLVNRCGQIVAGRDGTPLGLDVPLLPIAPGNPGGAEDPVAGTEIDGGSRPVTMHPPLEAVFRTC